MWEIFTSHRYLEDITIIDIIPEKDLKSHIFGLSCHCQPFTKENKLIIIHNSYDGREFNEKDNANLVSVNSTK